MTTAEQFKCLIPSPNALKEGVLYCSTNATNSTELWSLAIDGVAALATVATVGASILIAVASRSETKQAQRKAQKLEKQRERTRLIQSYLSELRAVVAEYPQVSDSTVQSYKSALIAIQESGSDHTELYLGGALQDMDDAIMFALDAASNKLKYYDGRLLKGSSETGKKVKELLVKNIDSWNRLLLGWNYSEGERSKAQERLEELATGLQASIEGQMKDLGL